MPVRPWRRRAVLPPTLHGLAVLLAAASPSAAPAAANEGTLPSIVGEHVRRHEPSGTVQPPLRIELAPAGLRVRERTDVGDLEIVQDFVAGRLWFVDRTRRLVHELELDRPPASTTPGAEPGSGFLGPLPCAGAGATPIGRGAWRGREVAAWRCHDANGNRVASELVDDVHGIVVRRESADGWIDELHAVRTVGFATAHFSPSPRYRSVDARELMRGAPAIGAFVDGADTDRARP